VAQCADKIHAEALEEAMHLIRDFVERMRAPPSQIVAWARPFLENLGAMLLEQIPPAGFPDQRKQLQWQYHQVFQNRTEGALRDIEIGFIGGRSVMIDSKLSQGKALLLLKSIYDHTRSKGDPVLATQIGTALGLTEEESQAAWRYLKESGLIQTFNLPGAARINAAGIDVIEGAQRHPDQPVHGFPAVSYNIVNNTTNIGTALNSPIQQAGPLSTQSQTTSFTSQERTDLTRLVDEFTAHLAELGLDARANQKVNAQLATLRAQLIDEPDRIIVQQAGRSLRNITEGAIGSLVAAAAQPTVWPLLGDIMTRLFS